jgi:hypothetical protein
MPRVRVVKLNAEFGDLTDNIVKDAHGVGKAIAEATVRPSKATVKVKGYDFSSTHSYEPSVLLDVISRDIDLKRKGSEWMGVCPFHGDTDPSLAVNDKKGLFFCHGCEAGGDVVSYIMLRDNVKFKEAKQIVEDLR